MAKSCIAKECRIPSPDVSADVSMKPRRTVSFSATPADVAPIPCEDLRRTVSASNPALPPGGSCDGAQRNAVTAAWKSSAANSSTELQTAAATAFSARPRKALPPPLEPLIVPDSVAAPEEDEAGQEVPTGEEEGSGKLLEASGSRGMSAGEGSCSLNFLRAEVFTRSSEFGGWPIPITEMREEVLGAKCGTPIGRFGHADVAEEVLVEGAQM